ncbi:MAG: DUF1702 family protein [Phycisphaerae bacterium]|nr:DUF1702 family protein [Phycisphaerae bacterium]
MGSFGYIVLTAALAVVVLLVSGWWRLVFVPFRIRPARMTVDRLGLAVGRADMERVNGVLSHFAGGFNAMLISPTWSGWRSYGNSCPVLFRPFAHEGAAMGYTPRRLFRCRPEEFEASVVKYQPAMRYMYYVGLGFWSGMRDHSPQRLGCIVDALDPLHGCLCYDGYGFKYGFFDYLKDPDIVWRFDKLEGYARNVAYQGLGRSFWFLFMGDHGLLIERISMLGDYAPDVAAGLGLASVFVFPDRLEVSRGLGMELPETWHDDFHLGMCFGLKARSICHPEQFERDLGRLESGVRAAVCASVQECDRIEEQLRAEQCEDGYQRWRGLVSRWMANHIEFPLAGLKSSVSQPLSKESAAL